ncbi:NAD-P-binding protein [Neolentinus lepideus HHB14362 ss-1]|uniref:NAD-P-binding protein n=1 Tax=Neolentinus lepideus HHB14362 ss-1 TaxID=1314782 RepID=A0A165PN51_9AGAM|nr:NAD-P-binding protein [Neolentinus lepideus HHB14362 ss-1]
MASTIPSRTHAYRLPKYEGIQSLVLEEGPIPKPKDNEVLVKVHAVSLNYRDLLIASGKYFRGLKTNVIPASDMSGTIVFLGSDVKGWQVGERVCASFFLDHLFGDGTIEAFNTALGGSVDGVLTEYRVFPAYTSSAQSLVRAPANLTHVEASTLPCAAVTAYNALLGLRPVKAGETVLCLGTGGVSIFAAQIAKASGAEVIITSSSDEKLALAKKLGAKHGINYKTHPEWEKEVLRITNGRGVDHVLEVGGPGTFDKSVASVRLQGNIYVIGSVAGIKEGSNVSTKVHEKGIVLRGILVGPRSSFEDMNRLIEVNNVKPAVSKVFSFEQAKEAYEFLQAQKHVGKVVIQVAQD